MIARLLRALHGDLELNSEEVADVVWLAARMVEHIPEESPETPADGTAGEDAPGRDWSLGDLKVPAGKADFKGEKQDGRPEEPAAGDKATTGARPVTPVSGEAGTARAARQRPPAAGTDAGGVPLYRRTADAAGAEASGGALALKVAGAASITNPRDLARALRPLIVRIPSRTHFRLDEDATVHRYAETRILMPVMVPQPERWLDLVLIVDGARSMRLWSQTVRELEPLLARPGAFRNVQRWTLDTEGSRPTLYRGRWKPGARAHSTREIVDPASDRFVVLASDCVAPSWSDGRMGRVLREWGRNELVVLLQMLPRRLWQSTGLAAALPVRLSQRVRGGNNDRMHSRLADPAWSDGGEETGVSIPVARLDADSLVRTANLIAARSGGECLGYRISDESPGSAGVQAGAGAPATGRPTARARVHRFDSAASPTAQRLARHLAAAPLSLPIMRLVRRTMLPEADDSHLAEVVQGGLLREHDVAAAEDSEAICYEFHEGVRERLLAGAPLSDTVAVLDRISGYLRDEHGGRGLEFRAVLLDRAALPQEVAEWEQPFAHVQASVLRRLGGDYARMAQRLERILPGSRVTESQDEPATAAADDRQLTCLALIGFGRRADYATGRILDLDQTWQRLIRPAFDRVGVNAFRAIDANLTGAIDSTLYRWIYEADIVVADLSTHDANVFYWLGVRHALRPNTTIIMAESVLVRKIPVDLSSFVIHAYDHGGDEIAPEEQERFVAHLSGIQQGILDSWKAVRELDPGAVIEADSPVYTFLPGMTPPRFESPTPLAPPPFIPPEEREQRQAGETESLAGLIRAAEAAKGRKDFPEAIRLFQRAIDSQVASKTASGQEAKADVFLAQRLALVTYKNGETKNADGNIDKERAIAALGEAEEILARYCAPKISTNLETLGLAGAINKRLFEWASDLEYLERAIRYYERAFFVGQDYYYGINAAFLNTTRANLLEDDFEAIAAYGRGNQIRHKVGEITTEIVEDEKFQSRGDKRWVLMTLAEAYQGLGESTEEQRLARRIEAEADDFAIDAYKSQRAKLAAAMEEFQKRLDRTSAREAPR